MVVIEHRLATVQKADRMAVPTYSAPNAAPIGRQAKLGYHEAYKR
jgi:hypothetical protein